VLEYLRKEYQPRITEYFVLTGELNEADEPDERTRIRALRTPHAAWFATHGRDIAAKFEPYLRIGL
jgi:hypothetical protein